MAWPAFGGFKFKQQARLACYFLSQNKSRKRNTQFKSQVDNGAKMDDETFLCIESLSRIDNSWDVSELFIPCVPFDGPLPIATGSGCMVNAADCIGHGGGRLVASTFSPYDVSRRGSTKYTRYTLFTWYTP